MRTPTQIARPAALVMAILVAAASARPARAELAVQSGDRILFLGDSITALGTEPVGYVSLVMAGLKTAGVEAEALTLRQLDALDARGATDGAAVQRLLQPRLDTEVAEFLRRR
ncbi:MAG TPA: hypothetical protein VNO26_02740 [Candidatus Limnocylindria bacterium]|nr:hypothetical protein [Candidatus Limnocylindria bacterium]